MAAFGDDAALIHHDDALQPLDGREPGNLSEEELKHIQCRRISYAGEILAWLKECRKAAARFR